MRVTVETGRLNELGHGATDHIPNSAGQPSYASSAKSDWRRRANAKPLTVTFKKVTSFSSMTH